MGPHRFRCLPHSLWIGAVLLVVCCSTSLLPSPDAGWAIASRQRRTQADSPMRQFVRQELADQGKSADEINRQIAEWSDADRVAAELEEERKGAAVKAVPKSTWQKIKANDGLRDSIGGALPYVIGGLSNLATMDFQNSSPKQIAQAIGAVAVPIITAGLALIPGVGPIISGLFGGVWNMVSSLWLGEEEQESPMEKMVKEAMKQMREELDAKMGTFLTDIIRGELSRNKYVCDKYAIVSKNFTENYVAGGKKLNDSFRLEMMMFMDNCDNFLQDTQYGLQNHNFPDALWQVSALAAVAQVAFLADSVNVGKILGLPQAILTNYFVQLEKALADQFKMFKEGQPIRQYKFNDKPYSTEERESCRTQAQLIYMNRDLYPYGMPRKFTARDLESFVLDADDLTMQDPKTKKPIDHDHVQIFATETKYPDAFDDWGQVNCIMGPFFSPFYQNQVFRVKVSFIEGHTFELRVLYFIRPQYVLKSSSPGRWSAPLTPEESNKKATLKSNADGHLVVVIEDDPDPDNVHAFESDSGCMTLNCVGHLAPLNPVTLEYEPCWAVTKSDHDGGRFYIDEVGVYDVAGTGRTDLTIDVKKPDKKYATFIVGVELIIHKMVKM